MLITSKRSSGFKDKSLPAFDSFGCIASCKARRQGFFGVGNFIVAGLFAVCASLLPGSAGASDLPPVAHAPIKPIAAPAQASVFQPARPAEWAVTLFGGLSNKSVFTSIIFTPWETQFEDTQLLAGAISKRVYEFSESSLLGPHWFVDLEVGAGKRFGNSKAGEFWTALYVKYDNFYWSDTVYTTVGFSTGLNYATSISALEVRKSGNNKGSKLLHYFAPEITFANPDYKDFEIVTRFHHRSGVFGLFNGVDGGSTFVTLGIRQHF